MEKRKLTKTALSFIIIQTILTFGLNWVYFLIYFGVENAMINSILHKNIKKKKLTLISVISLSLCLFILAFILLVNKESSYFFYGTFKTSLFVLMDYKFLFFVIFIILLFVLSVYIYFIKELYENLFKIKRGKPKKLLEWILTVLTWIYKIFVLGFYELYVYLINKNINHKKSKISLLGKFSLLLIYTILFINIIYMFINISFLNVAFIYLIILSLINPILNYGLYELKMKIILNEELNRFEREVTDGVFRFNKILYSLYAIIMVIFILNITVFIKDNKFIDFNVNTQNLTCQNDNNINVCMKDNANQLPPNLILNTSFGDHGDHFSDYVKHIDDFTFNYHNLDKINPKGIIYTDKYKKDTDNLVYKSEGILDVKYFYSTINYVYVETYYHKSDNNTYVPLFNIIKTIVVFPTFNTENLNVYDLPYKKLEMDETVYYDRVFIYDFLNNTLSPYDRDYKNIDTSRLIIDNFNVQLISNTNNLIGYDADAFHSGDALVNNSRFNYFDQSLKQYALSFIDPFMVTSSLMFNSTYFNSIGETDEKSNLKDLLDLKLHDFDIKSIQYPFDLQYILLNDYDDVHLVKYKEGYHISNVYEEGDLSYRFYYNKNNEITTCPWNNKYDVFEKISGHNVLNDTKTTLNYISKCIDNNKAEFTNTLDLSKLPSVERMNYGDDELLTGDKFYDFYGKDFSSIEPIVTYDIKTIQQHFSSGSIMSETLNFNDKGERINPEA